MFKIFTPDGFRVSVRVRYALIECSAGCQISSLMINPKDFDYTSNWCCPTCIDK